MQAVYSLGKLPSKYTILDIIGFAHYREDAALLLYEASRRFRRLLEKEYLIFIHRTKQRELELESLEFKV